MHAKEREVEMERKAAMKYMQGRWGLADTGMPTRVNREKQSLLQL